MSQHYSFYDPDLITHPTVFSSVETGSLDTSGQYSLGQHLSPQQLFLSSMSRYRPSASGQSSLQDSTKLSQHKGLPYPPLPTPISFSAYTQPETFKLYIDAQCPSFPPTVPAPSTQISSISSSEDVALRSRVNPMFLEPTIQNIEGGVESLDWVGKALFPDSTLPVPYDENLVRESQSWSEDGQTFAAQLTEMGEAALAKWLNDLCDIIGTIHGIVTPGSSPRRVKEGCGNRFFDPRHHNRGPAGAVKYSKPDVTLIDDTIMASLHAGDRLRWEYFHAIVEVSASTSVPGLLKKLVKYSSSIFETQAHRRFICGLGFKRGPSVPLFFLVLVDRSGTTWSKAFPVNSYFALSLGRILFALAFAPAATVGCDPTMKLHELTYKVIQITVQDTRKGHEGREETFNVVKEIHRTYALHGRGTRVFIVKSELTGKYYILKDSWILASHQISEIQQLDDVAAVIADAPEKEKFEHICPTIYMGQDLGDRTNLRRGALLQVHPPRVHRRIVTGPVGDPITTFRSRKELVKVLIDVVDFLDFLDTKCGLVHGDISMHNIVINRVLPIASPNNPKVTQDGYHENIPAFGSPIDYDYCRRKDLDFRHTSGTRPYMSLRSLVVRPKDVFMHAPADDLESLLYILLGICHFTDGPYGQVRVPCTDDEKNLPMCLWYDTSMDRGVLGRLKSIHLLGFDQDIKPKISPYWSPFTPYLKKLIEATFGDLLPYHEEPNRATHAQYRSILQEALDNLPEETLSPYAHISLPKRNREGSHNDERRKKLRRMATG